MKAVYMTFASEAEALAALFDGDAPRYPGLEILSPVPMPVCRATCEENAGGAPIMAQVPGYHVNCVCRGVIDLAALDPWRVYPETPFAELAG